MIDTRSLVALTKLTILLAVPARDNDAVCKGRACVEAGKFQFQTSGS